MSPWILPALSVQWLPRLSINWKPGRRLRLIVEFNDALPLFAACGYRCRTCGRRKVQDRPRSFPAGELSTGARRLSRSREGLSRHRLGKRGRIPDPVVPLAAGRLSQRRTGVPRLHQEISKRHARGGYAKSDRRISRSRRKPEGHRDAGPGAGELRCPCRRARFFYSQRPRYFTSRSVMRPHSPFSSSSAE